MIKWCKGLNNNFKYLINVVSVFIVIDLEIVRYVLILMIIIGLIFVIVLIVVKE